MVLVLSFNLIMLFSFFHLKKPFIEEFKISCNKYVPILPKKKKKIEKNFVQYIWAFDYA